MQSGCWEVMQAASSCWMVVEQPSGWVERSADKAALACACRYCSFIFGCWLVKKTKAKTNASAKTRTIMTNPMVSIWAFFFMFLCSYVFLLLLLCLFRSRIGGDGE